MNVYKNFIYNCQYLEVISIDEWINKLWYIHLIEYYSEIKKKEWVIKMHKCMDEPQMHMLSEKEASCNKASYYMISFIWHVGKRWEMV